MVLCDDVSNCQALKATEMQVRMLLIVALWTLGLQFVNRGV
jgi:hypothetical protein